MSTTTKPLAAHEIETTKAWGVDLAKDVPCMAPKCKAPATWVLYTPCGHTILGCGPCRTDRDQYFIDNPGNVAVCLTCREYVPLPLGWRRL